MAHFCLLKDPDSYVAHDYDLVTDEEGREYWMENFSQTFTEAIEQAKTKYGDSANDKIARAKRQFDRILELLKKGPDSLPGGKLSLLEFSRLTSMLLRENEIPDPYQEIKEAESNEANKQYAKAVAEINKLEGEDRWMRLISGVFAGEMFMLGDETQDFTKCLKDIKPRPWLVDDFDTFWGQVSSGTPYKWKKAIVFVDKAGNDFILGVMPMLKELAAGGTSIMLVANELPTLKDLTVDETLMCLENLTMLDMDLGMLLNDNKFDAVSSGSDLPLLDLSNVSDSLNATAQDADLVILEGQSRAIQSNFNAKFTVDCLQLAVVCDDRIAKRYGGEVPEFVCKFVPAG